MEVRNAFVRVLFSLFAIGIIIAAVLYIPKLTNQKPTHNTKIMPASVNATSTASNSSKSTGDTLPALADTNKKLKLTGPVISIDFDDGWSSYYETALPIMNRFGIKSTQYIVSGWVNTPNFMTEEQILATRSQGHYIGSHTVSHKELDSISGMQLDVELSKSKEYLENLLKEPIDHFVTPFCKSSQAVEVTAQKYYKTVRNCGQGEDTTTSNYNPYNLHAEGILKDTTVDILKIYTDRAKKNNGWLTLIYHRVDRSGDTYALTPEEFTRHMQFLVSTGIPILPTPEVYSTFTEK